MNMAKYCKNAGMTLTEYENFKKNISITASAIAEKEKLKKDKSGMYYPVNNILTYSPGSELQPFIIQELKQKHGFEFRENNTLYRP